MNTISLDLKTTRKVGRAAGHIIEANEDVARTKDSRLKPGKHYLYAIDKQDLNNYKLQIIVKLDKYLINKYR